MATRVATPLVCAMPGAPGATLPLAMPDDLPLGELIQRVARAERAALAHRLAPHGLHPGQEAVLRLLVARPGLRQAELARALHLEAPTVSRMLHRMERAGLVERRPDRHDARVVRVVATPRAQLLDAVVRRASQEVAGILDDALGAAGVEALRDGLAAAVAALTSRAVRSPE